MSEQTVTADFREKAHAMAVVALEDAFQRAVDPDTSLKLKLDFTELCTKLADLHPRQTQQQAVGPGFSINIMLDGESHKAEAKFVEVIDNEPTGLDNPPTFLPKTLASSINMDLTEEMEQLADV